MSALNGFWRFLNTDITALPWDEGIEKVIEAIATTNDFAEAWEENAPEIKQLEPYLEDVKPFLQVFNNPVTQLATSSLPFVSIGVGFLKLYLDLSKKKLNLAESAAVVAQLAYIQSLEAVIEGIADAEIKAKLEKVSLKKLNKKQQKYLEDLEISSSEAKAIANRFRESNLAQKFGEILSEQLQEAGLEQSQCIRLAERVQSGTHRYLYQAIAEAGDSVAALAKIYELGGQKTQECYDSITNYLEKKIKPLPDGQVFDEANPKISFRDIYVPLTVQPLNQDGSENSEAQPINIHDWALDLLENPSKPRKVMFVEGEAGRGKSVFCRMFADLVRRELYPIYAPLFIRLRDIIHLESNLTETLEKCPGLEQQDFVCSDGGWLSDPNVRFLIILDGFDELLLEGRATGGLEDFLKQVANFQENSQHQCLVTGRPLALQGFERLITQNKNRLERVRLEPMADEQQDQWLANWQELFGEEEVDKFRNFLKACPEDIADDLAREPLLIYLLGRLHREGQLNAEMFSGVEERVQAKICIYRESVQWVLEKQRQNENFRLSGLKDLEDLREVLQETALCVVQSGNETAQLSMLKNRFQDSENPVAKFLKESQEITGQSEDKALNNLLTTFYLSPGEGDKRGSVEFAHKSFGEYLFAERLINAFEAWTEQDRRKRFRMSEGSVNSEIYDLLGYGGLSVDIVEYLFELLTENEVDPVLLFNRLHEFYLRWCEGEFLDQRPNENLPQKKMLQLLDQGVETGLRQVDIFAGLNVMILLFRLHAAAQSDDYPHDTDDSTKPIISFHPCGEFNSEQFDKDRLFNLIHYIDSLGLGTFAQQVGPHLSCADLRNSFLYSAQLYKVNLSRANLSHSTLNNSNLNQANLTNANLVSSNLTCVAIGGADLQGANFEGADLESTCFRRSDFTNVNLERAILLETDLRLALNLTTIKLSSGESSPLFCGALLDFRLDVDPNRDWDRLPQAIHKKYPFEYETVEQAKTLLRWRYSQ